MFVYLFEAKSIQSYLFQSGKLKDVISASERLDRLIDNNESSVLAQVIQFTGLDTDLFISSATQSDISGNRIGFIRCKGGAFYAWCHQQAPLVQLRSTWTLTVQQLFPGMTFCDALCEAESLQAALQLGHQQLAGARNLPRQQFPMASAPCQAASRTGFAAVPLSRHAKLESHLDSQEQIDTDTELHRQCYRMLALRKTPLLNKFCGRNSGMAIAQSLPEDLRFPLDTEDFYSELPAGSDGADIRDLALIHIDGNGLGLQLRALRNALSTQPDQAFAQGFRQFSDALARATEEAAAFATQALYQAQLASNTDISEIRCLAMRPLVLGGDDITLLCRADLAMDYGKNFCLAFEKASKKHLQKLHSTYLKGQKQVLPYLTASGGVLYHKSNHPFMLCHQLVEDLCLEAKCCTKRQPEHLPAALSFYRISKAFAEDMPTLRRLSQHWQWQGKPLQSSLQGYLVPDATSQTLATINRTVSLTALDNAVAFLRDKQSGQPSPLSINKLRQMATELGRDNADEAERIYDRAVSQLSPERAKQWLACLGQLFPPALLASAHKLSWCWQETTVEGETLYRTWLTDLLIYNHFISQQEQN